MTTFHMMPIQRYPIVDANIIESYISIFYWFK